MRPNYGVRGMSDKRTALIYNSAYLGTPVSEVVHRDHFPSARLVEVREERANDGAPQVADVEGFGDVGGGVLDDDTLALAEVVRAIFRLF